MTLLKVLACLLTIRMAYAKGRNPLIWGIFAAYFPFVALILVVIFPDLKVWREIRRQLDPLFQQYSQRQQRQEKEEEEWKEDSDAIEISVEEVIKGAASGNGTGATWWYLDSNQEEKGTYSLSEIEALIKSGQINSHVYMWKEGMQEWKQAEKIPEFSTLL